MTELLSLDHYKDCPKCGSDWGFDKDYCDGRGIEVRVVEYIRMTCRDCRFAWLAKTKEKTDDR